MCAWRSKPREVQRHTGEKDLGHSHGDVEDRRETRETKETDGNTMYDADKEDAVSWTVD